MASCSASLLIELPCPVAHLTAASALLTAVLPAFSVLDTNLVQGIDFVTGGMTADFGDYMSGAVGLQTRRPTPDDSYRNGVGISFVSAYGRSSGTFSTG